MVNGLTVDEATVRYGETVAVDRVSLEVEQGEVIALLGASGSGKSSLLRGIAGLEPLSTGSVAWNGQDLTRTPVHKRSFGMMFQDGQLFPNLTVGGNVEYGLYKWKRAERRQRVEELLEIVGLPGYGPRPVASLSGGQAQRVALARSLAPRPRLLLLDEPLSALDRGLRERLVEELGDGLRATETTGIYVTHDQDEAFAIADRVAVLEGGRLLQIAPPEELWARPSSQAVAAFLGFRPFLDAELAIRLGWPAESAPTPDHLVGIGPVGLVTDPAGVLVEVLDQQYQRGFVEVEVALPDGQRATVRAGERVPEPRVGVRLDPAGCVQVPDRQEP